MTGSGDGRDPFGEYRRVLAERGFLPQRRLGQNFLLDPSLHRFIADSVEVAPGDLVLEVGAGLGFLTRELAARCGRLIAVEVDPRLCGILRDELLRMRGGDRVLLLDTDVLGAGGALAAPVVESVRARSRSAAPGGRFLCVANLPYAISGPFLAAVVTAEVPPPDAMALLVQLELAERIAAGPGTAAYGNLSALLQAGYAVRLLRRVGREVFRPRPRVDSAVLRLSRRPDSALHGAPMADRRGFARLLRAVFGQRRKTLRNAWSRAGRQLGVELPEAALGDWAGRRAQELGPMDLVAIWRRAAVSS